MEQNGFLGDDDFMYNTSARLPVVFCVDTSGSMSRYVDESGTAKEDGVRLIDLLVNGVNAFYDAIRNNERARHACEIAIVSFDQDVRVLEDFQMVDDKRRFEAPKTNGETRMGEGVLKALELLEGRKRKYKFSGVEYYQPWLVLFTDGEPTDEYAKAQVRIRELEVERKLHVQTVAISDEVDMDVLSGFSIRRPISVDYEGISDFFEWLGASVEKIYDTIRPDESAASDWESI